MIAHPFFKLYADLDDGPVCPTRMVAPTNRSGQAYTHDELRDKDKKDVNIKRLNELVLGEIAATEPVELHDTTQSPDFIL